MDDRKLIEDKVRRILGEEPVDFVELEGGMIGTVFQVDVESGRKLVVKLGSDHLDIEGYMLNYLKDRTELPVPEVYYSSKGLLLMEYMNGDSSMSEEVEKHAAKLLSRLHEITWHSYGFQIETLTGPIIQPNEPNSSWIDFFRKNRLEYMMGVVRDAGTVPEGTVERIVELSDNLDDHLFEPVGPSLIHGDVWKTNILVEDDRINSFLDPALYYAHHEVELAYIVFCSTFGDTFFQCYQERRKLEPGFFEERCPIYNLYPLMIHAHLFGEDYVEQIEDNLDKVGY